MLARITRIKQSILLITLALASGLLAKPMVPACHSNELPPGSIRLGTLSVHYPDHHPDHAPENPKLLKNFRNNKKDIFDGVILANTQGDARIHIYGHSPQLTHFAVWVPKSNIMIKGSVRAGTPIVLNCPPETHYKGSGPVLYLTGFDKGEDRAGPSNRRQTDLQKDGGPDSTESSSFSYFQHQPQWK
jgi:hypothetical protein